MRRLALLTIMSAALLLQGCGFHLKGKVELSPTLQNVYVEGRDPAMVADLRRSLEFSGARVVSSAEAANSALLVDSRYRREVRTLNSRGLATGYTLRYEARFAVVTPSGEEIFRSSLISVRRNFDFDADKVLQKETEEEFLQDDMREKIVQRIMRQLSTI